MKLSKKLSVILSTIITSSAILLASTTVAHAKASSIVVLTKDNSYYEYNYADLKASAVSKALGNTANAALYEHFLLNKTSIQAFFDDLRNVYVSSSVVNQQAVTSKLSGTTFNFNSYLEDSTTPSTTVTATKVQNNSGTITPPGVGSTDTTDFDVSSID